MSKAKHKPEKTILLCPYVGLDRHNKLGIFVSVGELNPIGMRCQKGTPFPDTLAIWLEHPSWEGMRIVLEDMKGYFEKQSKR